MVVSLEGWHICHDGRWLWLATVEELGGIMNLTQPQYYSKEKRIRLSPCWICEWAYEYDCFMEENQGTLNEAGRSPSVPNVPSVPSVPSLVEMGPLNADAAHALKSEAMRALVERMKSRA